MAKEGKFAVFDDTRYIYSRRLVPMIMERFRRVVRTHAEMIQDHIKKDFRKPKTGRVYWRPGGRVHIASAPGEAPAIDTGRLDRDIKIRYRQMGLVAVIGTTNTGYAEYLEKGTPRGKMAARPFAAPAHNQYAERFRYQMALAVASI